jgi:antirestriction protein ArdC
MYESKHELITSKLIESLEQNVIPWKKPWNSLAAKNLVSKKEYRGINSLLLGMTPAKYPFFATFKQIMELGGNVKKGSKSVPVFFYAPVSKKGSEVKFENEASVKSNSYWLMKQYAVFSIDQVEGIDVTMLVDEVINFQPILMAEDLVNGYLASQSLKIYSAQNAAYSPSHDQLVMPEKNQFHSVDAYYSTVFHELIHSTGSAKRLNREGFEAGVFHKFGSKGYAFEELIAEFGAAILASHCGVDTSLETGQSGAYIKEWLKKLNEDKTLAYKAALKAQLAVDYILKESGLRNINTEAHEAI